MDTHSWGLNPMAGMLYRLTADYAAGRLALPTAPLTPGYPDACKSPVMVDVKGRPASLNGRATGCVIECAVDEESGRLVYRIDDGPLLPTEAVFPPGAPLRKWAFIVDPQDKVVVEPRAGG